jgi:N-acetyl-gamma-glutamyl-phosphate reductase
MTDIAIVGASGFSGIELVRAIDKLPAFTLKQAFADRFSGTLGAHIDGLTRFGSLVVTPSERAQASLIEAEIVLLATPAEVSAKLGAELIASGKRVVDLSGAFRLRDREVFHQAYGFDAPPSSLLEEATYGLPQVPATWGSTEPMRQTRLIANPGCYATAAILPLAALLHAKLIEPHPIFSDGKSGVTGAGRKIAEKYLFTEVAENCSPYRVGNHQHTPEIEQALTRVANETVRVTFTPHLLPLKRGLIVTSTGTIKPLVSQTQADEALARFFESHREFIEISSCNDVTIASVAHTPRARIGVHIDAERKTFVAICAIDNLLKGAASQAIENLIGITS